MVCPCCNSRSFHSFHSCHSHLGYVLLMNNQGIIYSEIANNIDMNSGYNEMEQIVLWTDGVYGRKVSSSGRPVGGAGEELRGNLRSSMEVPGATCCLWYFRYPPLRLSVNYHPTSHAWHIKVSFSLKVETEVQKTGNAWYMYQNIQPIIVQPLYYKLDCMTTFWTISHANPILNLKPWTE